MLEQRRQEYLSTLGIDTFVPRRLIAGARPSPALVAVELSDNPDKPEPADQEAALLSQESTGVVAPEAPEAQSSKPESRVEVAEPVLAKATGAEREHPTPAKDNSPEKTVAVQTVSKSLGFVLNIWSVNDLVVVNTHEPGSALPVDRLLQNMLFAMGYPLVQLPSADVVRWPLFKNDPNNNPEEARAMVEANLNARCSQQQRGAKVLLMGATSAQMLLGESGKQHGYQKYREDWQASLLYLPSLQEILQNPASKKTVWQSWQALQDSGAHS